MMSTSIPLSTYEQGRIGFGIEPGVQLPSFASDSEQLSRYISIAKFAHEQGLISLTPGHSEILAHTGFMPEVTRFSSYPGQHLSANTNVIPVSTGIVYQDVLLITPAHLLDQLSNYDRIDPCGLINEELNPDLLGLGLTRRSQALNALSQELGQRSNSIYGGLGIIDLNLSSDLQHSDWRSYPVTEKTLEMVTSGYSWLEPVTQVLTFAPAVISDPDVVFANTFNGLVRGIKGLVADFSTVINYFRGQSSKHPRIDLVPPHKYLDRAVQATLWELPVLQRAEEIHNRLLVQIEQLQELESSQLTADELAALQSGLITPKDTNLETREIPAAQLPETAPLSQVDIDDTAEVAAVQK